MLAMQLFIGIHHASGFGDYALHNNLTNAMANAYILRRKLRNRKG